MLSVSCLCGSVRVDLRERPGYIHACNCTLCSKSGAHWGYFDPADIAVTGTTRGYSRDDKPDPAAEIRFCEICGATTHFVLTAGAIAKFGNAVTGVNMLLADERDLSGIELRFPDGRAWTGEGAFTYVREPRILGGAASS